MQNELVATLADGQNARPKAILRSKRIRATRNALRDGNCFTVRTLANLRPKALALKFWGNGQLRGIEQRGREIQHAEGKFRDFLFCTARHPQQQRHVDQLFGQLRRMITPAMIEKFLAVVSRKSENTIGPSL